MSRADLAYAKTAKNDEFYTSLYDIQEELQHYVKHFKGKTVLCNANDSKRSNFFICFQKHFRKLKLKKLICISYGKKARAIIITKKRRKVVKLKGDGDFRSKESVRYLKQADIVVTNPPFSLFREFLKQLMQHDKKFLIVGNQNAITYKSVFPLIKADVVRLGYKSMTERMEFSVPDNRKHVTMGFTVWFTNLKYRSWRRNFQFSNSLKFYPTYDNYDAIEVSRVMDIPTWYNGEMGVPITFLDKYDPEQYRIVAADFELVERDRFYLNGKRLYSRIIIKKRI